MEEKCKLVLCLFVLRDICVLMLLCFMAIEVFLQPFHLHICLLEVR